MQLLASLLPPEIALEAMSLDALPLADAESALYPDELPAIARAVEKRRREFAFGRACARAALARLGIPALALPRSAGGPPAWPPGIIGSITHGAGIAAAAVAPATACRSLGIDLESLAAAREADVLATVATPAELSRYADSLGSLLGPLLFSAKESVYKCLYPLERRFLDFTDVELALAPDTASFTVVRATGCDVRGLGGRYAIDASIVATAVIATTI